MALKRARLKANFLNSQLRFQELKHLEYLVSCGFLKPLPEKLLSLEHHLRPTNKLQLQQFLGFLGYYS